MSKVQLSLDDQKLIELYQKFQRKRQSAGHIYEFVGYEHLDGTRVGRGAGLAALVTAADHISAAANSLNRFSYDLHNLRAWSSVFADVTENDRLAALYEFVLPIASATLALPYSLKQMFVRSVYQTSYHTNCLLDASWREKVFKDSVNFDDTEKQAKSFGFWPPLNAALANLNGADFVKESQNYRTWLNHGFPPRIEFGHTFNIKQERGKSLISYAIVDTPPITIADILPLLVAQHTAGLRCFERYCDLMREQQVVWSA